MEPMTLGSPVHSPGPPSAHYPHGGSPSVLQGMTTTPNHSGFLPGFLMGEPSSPPPNNPQQTPSSRILSPTKLNRSISHQQQGLGATPSRFNKSLRGTPGAEKTPGSGGPPITGLYSKVGTPNSCSTPGQSSHLFPTSNHLANITNNASSASTVNPEPDEGESSSPWITIFGFPPSATGYILSQFSQYGVVLQHESPPNGNWMALRYQTKLMAQKALSKNGKVLGGSIMIGVAMGGGPSFEGSEALESPNGGNNMSILNASNKHETSVLNRSTIRPLTQAYKVSQNEHEVLADSNTPRRNNGFVNKAMEYIFGW